MTFRRPNRHIPTKPLISSDENMSPLPGRPARAPEGGAAREGGFVFRVDRYSTRVLSSLRHWRGAMVDRLVIYLHALEPSVVVECD